VAADSGMVVGGLKESLITSNFRKIASAEGVESVAETGGKFQDGKGVGRPGDYLIDPGNGWLSKGEV